VREKAPAAGGVDWVALDWTQEERNSSGWTRIGNP